MNEIICATCALCQKFSWKDSRRCSCKLDVQLAVQLVVQLESVCISNSHRWSLVLHETINSSYSCSMFCPIRAFSLFSIIFSFRLVFCTQWFFAASFQLRSHHTCMLLFKPAWMPYRCQICLAGAQDSRAIENLFEISTLCCA